MLEIVAISLTILIMSFTIHAGLDCNDIIDIYYRDGDEEMAYDMRCKYTKTPRNCEQCPTIYISRKEYEKIAKGYKDLGLQPPPKRMDLKYVYPPKQPKYDYKIGDYK